MAFYANKLRKYVQECEQNNEHVQCDDVEYFLNVLDEMAENGDFNETQLLAFKELKKNIYINKGYMNDCLYEIIEFCKTF